MSAKRADVARERDHIDTAFNWDDVRLFLILARTGSLRRAAAEAAISRSALMRHIVNLEQRTNCVLFRRTKQGMVLTEEGEKVRSAGELMLQQARLLSHVSQRPKPGLRATVRLGITEGLGTFWLIPRILDFSLAEPAVQVSIKCDMRPPDIEGLEVDFAVQLDPPEASDLIVTRLGWIHIAFFASERYVRRFGAPETQAEVPNHPFIELVANQIPSQKLQEDVTREDHRAFVGLRVNTSSAQVLAVTSGAGVTALPTYARALAPSLVHVARDFHIRRDIWLVYHRRAGDLPHVRKAIDWVKRSFDPQRYPWFGEDYIEPDRTQMLAAERGQLFSDFQAAEAFR